MKAQFASETSGSGEFQRQEDAFRDWISADGSTAYPAAAGRYHLYISLACPWASRTFIVRNLKGLQDAVGLTIVDPVRDEKGWAFRDPSGNVPLDAPFESTDPVNGFHYLREAYAATDPKFDERVTVPVLWDKETKKLSTISRTTFAGCSMTRSTVLPGTRSSIFSLTISRRNTGNWRITSTKM